MQTRWLTFLLLLSGCFYVSADEHSARWDVDQDGMERPEDCDDKDKNVQELTWYDDADGDGFGDGGTGVSACEQPAGTSANGDDCDDAVATTNPDAAELCNEVDDDCNELVDDGEGLVPLWFPDDDGDGFGDPTGNLVMACDAPPGFVADNTDCDDGDTYVNPDAEDICDGINNDCEGIDDDDEAYWVDWYVDGDGDLYGDEDTLPTVTACFGNLGDVANFDDCDDGDGDINPDEDEICDGVDNDCDGATDPADSVGAPEWFDDLDEDGYGVAGTLFTQCVCVPPFCLGSPNAQDCDDTNPNISPLADEICGNLIDDNCLGGVDEIGCINCDTADTGC